MAIHSRVLDRVCLEPAGWQVRIAGPKLEQLVPFCTLHFADDFPKPNDHRRRRRQEPVAAVTQGLPLIDVPFGCVVVATEKLAQRFNCESVRQKPARQNTAEPDTHRRRFTRRASDRGELEDSRLELSQRLDTVDS